MIDYQTYCQIRLLHQQKGLKVSQIAQELKLDPKTVAKWIEQPSFQPRPSPKRPSKLDPFKGQIVALLERYPYTAQQILQQLQHQGYAGGYSILKEYVRLVRPPRKPAFLMLEFAPGECAQVDWGQYGSVPVGSTRRRSRGLQRSNRLPVRHRQCLFDNGKDREGAVRADAERSPPG